MSIGISQSLVHFCLILPYLFFLLQFAHISYLFFFALYLSLICQPLIVRNRMLLLIHSRAPIHSGWHQFLIYIWFRIVIEFTFGTGRYEFSYMYDDDHQHKFWYGTIYIMSMRFQSKPWEQNCKWHSAICWSVYMRRWTTANYPFCESLIVTFVSWRWLDNRVSRRNYDHPLCQMAVGSSINSPFPFINEFWPKFQSNNAENIIRKINQLMTAIEKI